MKINRFTQKWIVTTISAVTKGTVIAVKLLSINRFNAFYLSVEIVYYLLLILVRKYQKIGIK